MKKELAISNMREYPKWLGGRDEVSSLSYQVFCDLDGVLVDLISYALKELNCRWKVSTSESHYWPEGWDLARFDLTAAIRFSGIKGKTADQANTWLRECLFACGREMEQAGAYSPFGDQLVSTLPAQTTFVTSRPVHIKRETERWLNARGWLKDTWRVACTVTKWPIFESFSQHALNVVIDDDPRVCDEALSRINETTVGYWDFIIPTRTWNAGYVPQLRQPRHRNVSVYTMDDEDVIGYMRRLQEVANATLTTQLGDESKQIANSWSIK